MGSNRYGYWDDNEMAAVVERRQMEIAHAENKLWLIKKALWDEMTKAELQCEKEIDRAHERFRRAEAKLVTLHPR